jgi:Fe-S-cluster containining protein
MRSVAASAVAIGKPMDIEEVYRSCANALRKINKVTAENDVELSELRAVLDQLIEILIANGVLVAGHRRVFEKTAQVAARGTKPRVKLRVLGDKYQMQGADIDCAARFHLCHARCCSLTFALSRQDVEEGKVLWEIDEPYIIRHEEDGHCSHLDRKTHFCTVHAHRPGTCRQYDCRGDTRIWIDFEAGIPAPLDDGILPRPVNDPDSAAPDSDPPREK